MQRIKAILLFQGRSGKKERFLPTSGNRYVCAILERNPWCNVPWMNEVLSDAVCSPNQMASGLLRILFYCLLIYELCSGLSHAQVPPQSPLEGKKVLVMHAFESNVPVFELADRGLKASLDTDGVGIRNQFF